MSQPKKIRQAIAAITLGVMSAAVLTAIGAAAAPGAVAATNDEGECLINAVISQDITRSFSDANLEDTKGQIGDAVDSFVGSPFPVTLGITTFGQVAPLPADSALLGVDVSAQAGADQFSDHVDDYGFEQMSGYTNWQAGLRDAFDKAKAQGADTVVFVTDGVPNTYTDDQGNEVGVGGWGTFDPAAAAAAAQVADEIRASGMHLETIFIRTGRPGFHGLDDPELPTPNADVEAAMQKLQTGWTIDRVITIAELAQELRERAAAACTTELSLTKSHGTVDDVNDNGLVDAGDRVVFTFTGRNDGDLPLTGVRVVDEILAARGVALNGDGLVGDLAIGQSYTVESAPYTLSMQDMLDCGFRNVAAVSGDSIKGALHTEDDDTVAIDARPGATIDTRTGNIVDANNDGIVGNAGDTVTWDVTVTNTGNVPWAGATVAAELVQHAALALTSAGTWDGSLAPAASMSFVSAPYTITAADERAGELTSTVTMSSPGMCTTPVTASADAKFTTASTPTKTPPPAAASNAHAPRAFTGNPFDGANGDWAWMLTIGLGGIAATTAILIARHRRSREDRS